MAKAADIATALRTIADALDKEPAADLHTAYLHFWCDSKEQFLAGARLLPRPFKKSVDTYGSEEHRRVHLETALDGAGGAGVAVKIDNSVYQSLTCTLVEAARPARYECDPVLSQLEEEGLGVVASQTMVDRTDHIAAATAVEEPA